MRTNRNIILTTVVAGVVGIGLGASSAKTIEVPGPERVITVQAPAPSPQVIEVPGPTVTIEVTPRACVDALDVAQDALGYAAAAIGALLDEDYTAIEDAANDMDSVDVDQFQTDAAACRAGTDIGS